MGKARKHLHYLPSQEVVLRIPYIPRKLLPRYMSHKFGRRGSLPPPFQLLNSPIKWFPNNLHIFSFHFLNLLLFFLFWKKNLRSSEKGTWFLRHSYIGFILAFASSIHNNKQQFLERHFVVVRLPPSSQSVVHVYFVSCSVTVRSTTLIVWYTCVVVEVFSWRLHYHLFLSHSTIFLLETPVVDFVLTVLLNSLLPEVDRTWLDVPSMCLKLGEELSVVGFIVLKWRRNFYVTPPDLFPVFPQHTVSLYTFTYQESEWSTELLKLRKKRSVSRWALFMSL